MGLSCKDRYYILDNYVIANQSADWCGNPLLFPGVFEKLHSTSNSMCYFLVAEQESNQRSQLKRALRAALPRAKSAPLKNLPGAHLVTSQHLNYLKL